MASGLSETERVQVQELREQVKDLLTDYYDTDFNLLRWLQGYDFKMEAVVPKLRYHLKFRQSKWDLDGILKNRKRDHPIHKHWPSGLTGESGIPGSNTIIWVEPSGKHDAHGMLCTYPLNEVLQTRIYDYEKLLSEVMKVEAKTGKQSGVIYVLDLTGLKYDKNLMNLITGPFKLIVAFLAEHYVELFRHFVMVNVPSSVYHLYRFVRTLMPERTLKKAVILSDSNWKTEILSYADKEKLPTYWNEENDDGSIENVFSAVVQRTVPYPESNFYSETDEMWETFTELKVPAGKSLCHVVKVDVGAERHRKLNFKLGSNGEFGFGVFYSEDKLEEPSSEICESLEMVYPLINRIAGPLRIPIVDDVECTKSGYYYFFWSNNFAWWSAVTVRYFTETV